jgi:Tol biopolymer transport system component
VSVLRIPFAVARLDSPTGDGAWIALTSERNGSADIYRVHPDGSGLERLTDSPACDDHAAFSPDGRQIVFGDDVRV